MNFPRHEVLSLMEGEAGYCGATDQERWKGIVNHILKDYALSLTIADRLKGAVGHETTRQRLHASGQGCLLGEIDALRLEDVADASFMHDAGKAVDEKRRIAQGGRDRHHLEGWRMARGAGLPDAISNVALTHYFPSSGRKLALLDKIILLSDGMVSQEYMLPTERIEDIRRRWITQRMEAGDAPLIDPVRFEKYADVLRGVAQELFGVMGIDGRDPESVQAFLASVPRRLAEEQYLRRAYERGGWQDAVATVQRVRRRIGDDLRASLEARNGPESDGFN